MEAKTQVTNCNGSPISGVDVRYWISNSGGGSVGTTGSTGIVTKELFAGTYRFTAKINKTKQSADVIIAPTGIDHTFIPTQVNIAFSGNITIWIPNVGGITVTPGIYMFAGTYDFKFAQSGYTTFVKTMTVSGCEMNKNMVYIELLSSTGSGIPGGTVRYWDYGN